MTGLLFYSKQKSSLCKRTDLESNQWLERIKKKWGSGFLTVSKVKENS
jgi:hypothetical protein